MRHPQGVHRTEEDTACGAHTPEVTHHPVPPTQPPPSARVPARHSGATRRVLGGGSVSGPQPTHVRRGGDRRHAGRRRARGFGEMPAPARREPAGVRPGTATSACPAPPRVPAPRAHRRTRRDPRAPRSGDAEDCATGTGPAAAEGRARRAHARQPRPRPPLPPGQWARAGAGRGGEREGPGGEEAFPTLLNSGAPTCRARPPGPRALAARAQELCFCRFQKRLTSPCPAGVTTMSRLAAFSNTSTPSSRAWASSSSKSTCDRNWLYRTPGGEEARP